jgi:outer membrane murein-binding lipoprotein Lpp
VAVARWHQEVGDLATEVSTLAATVARLEDADRLGRESHMAVVNENVRLRAEVAQLRKVTGALDEWATQRGFLSHEDELLWVIVKAARDSKP